MPKGGPLEKEDHADNLIVGRGGKKDKGRESVGVRAVSPKGRGSKISEKQAGGNTFLVSCLT